MTLGLPSLGLGGYRQIGLAQFVRNKKLEPNCLRKKPRRGIEFSQR